MVSDLSLEREVVFTGPLYGKDKLSAYRNADVLVYPSVYENFPSVPLEAVACGTPVLVTESSGCAGVFKKIGVQNSVQYGDVAALGRKIEDILHHPDERREDVRKIRKYIVDNLNWGVVVEKMVNVYREVVERQ